MVAELSFFEREHAGTDLEKELLKTPPRWTIRQTNEDLRFEFELTYRVRAVENMHFVLRMQRKDGGVNLNVQLFRVPDDWGNPFQQIYPVSLHRNVLFRNGRLVGNEEDGPKRNLEHIFSVS